VLNVTWVIDVWDSSRMKADSMGSEQVSLSWERSIPGGHRQTAVGARAPGLAVEPGPSRQMWEQLVTSHGLGKAGWEKACISYRGDRVRLDQRPRPGGGSHWKMDHH